MPQSINPLVGPATSKSGGGGYTTADAPPRGNQAAVCLCVIDLGTHERSPYQGTERKPARMVYVVWELVALVKPGSTIRHTLGERYTLSFHEKAALRQMVEAWHGTSYTDGQTIDINALPGQPCFLNIAHEAKGDRIYPRVMGVAQPPAGVTIPGGFTAKSVVPFSWYIGCGQILPDGAWLPWCYGSPVKELIMASPEWKALAGSDDYKGSPGQDDSNDDPPF